MKWGLMFVGLFSVLILSVFVSGQTTCTDSDSGENFYEKGHTVGFNPQATPEFQNVDIWDVCLKDTEGGDSLISVNPDLQNAVYEYSCRDGLFYSQVYSCSKGCSNGACIGEGIERPSCTDSDGGKDFFVKGTIKDNSGEINEDFCFNDNDLNEYYCISDGTKGGIYYPCPNGCEDGACVEEGIKRPLISIATIKATYQIGEKINLTDPPEYIQQEQQPFVQSPILTGSIFSEDINYRNLLTEQFLEQQEFEGYIIQLKEEPLVVKEKELRITAERNAYGVRGFVAEASTYILPKRLEPTTPSNLQAKIQIHTNDLQQEHQNFKQNVLQALGRSQFSVITGNVISDGELSILGEYKNTFNGVALDITTEEANLLKELNEVKEVYPNYMVNITLSDSVPLINADDVWLLDSNGNNCATSGQPCLTGQGITIGIIDTGVDYTHEDLGGCFGAGCKVIGGWDFVNNDNDPMDDMGHGTHVAATAAGNGILKGVAPDANIVAYKVLGADGSGSFSWIISAIERSVDPNQDGDFSDHLDIISLSLGISCKLYFGGFSDFCGPNDPQSIAIDNAVDAGVIAIVAAGNDGLFGDGSGTIGSPGTARKAITVGAADKIDDIASFSSRGPVIWESGAIIKPDVVAPGVNICAAGRFFIDPSGQDIVDNFRCLDNEHITISGTSMATPHVSGAAALIKQAHPYWSPEEVKNSLKGTAVDLNEATTIQGDGKIDVFEVIGLENSITDIWDLFITSPRKDIFYIDDVITIKGNFPEDYDALSIQYANELEPNNWISEGITVIGSGNILAEFDSSVVDTGGVIKFKSEVTKDGIKKRDITNINLIDTESGWPKSLFEDFLSHPIVVDIEGDGTKEIIINTFSGKVYLLNSDGSFYAGWPVDFGSYTQSTISDIDNDGINEIIVAGWDGIYVLNKDGTQYTEGSWPKLKYTYGSATLADIEADGSVEIIIPASKTEVPENLNYIYIWDNTGNAVRGWPQYSGSSDVIFSEVSVADIDGDGNLEIVTGTSGDNWQDKWTETMNVFVFNNDGTIFGNWPQQTIGWVESSPVIGDIDNDGDLEIVAVASGGVYVWNSDGSLVSGWPLVIPNLQTGVPPILIDIDNDGDLEIVFTSRFNPPEDFIYIYHHDGNPVQGWPVAILDGSSMKQPIAGDIDGDGDIEIIAKVFNYLYAWHHDASLVEGFPIFFDDQGHGSNRHPFPVLEDIDNDNKVEILYLTTYSDVYLVELDGEYIESNIDWPMFQHDPQHTGCYNCNLEIISEPPSIRPQSKIVNNNNEDLSGTLLIKIQKKNNGLWGDYQTAVNEIPQTIPANGLVKLDAIFNPLNVVVNEVGNYRVYVEFSYGDSSVDANWEFEVI